MCNVRACAFDESEKGGRFDFSGVFGGIEFLGCWGGGTGKGLFIGLLFAGRAEYFSA